MKEHYPFQEIEPKWQTYWEDEGLFATDVSDAADKYYCLMMFPYPSGTLHVGARSSSRRKSRSLATVRRETPNSVMKSVLLTSFPLAMPSRIIWSMRRMR